MELGHLCTDGTIMLSFQVRKRMDELKPRVEEFGPKHKQSWNGVVPTDNEVG